MRLVLAQPYLTMKGGAERVILRIAQKYKAPIYTLEYDKSSTFPEFGDIDIKVIGKDIPFSDMLPYRAAQGLRYGYNFYNLKIGEDYDAINSHISPSEWIRNRNERVLWYCHTPPREVYDLYTERMKNRSYGEKFLYASFANAYKMISKGMVEKIEQIATNSSNTRERIIKYYSRDASVISPAIDQRDFTSSGDDKYFLCPSRILQTKRQDYVIEAFARFAKKHKNNKHRLVVAGALSKDGEHTEYFEKLQRMKVKGVTFKVNIGDDELRNLYSRCTAVLFAAINEDFGIVPLEAMASSKPVISVNEGGPRDTVANGITGFLVKSQEEMSEKMRLLADNPELAEEMGRKGKNRLGRLYSWEAFFKKFDSVLRKVANGESGAQRK